MRTLIFLLVAVVAQGGLAQADVFKCQDESGEWHFSEVLDNMPPACVEKIRAELREKEALKKKKLEEQKAKELRPFYLRKKDAAASEEAQTPPQEAAKPDSSKAGTGKPAPAPAAAKDAAAKAPGKAAATKPEPAKPSAPAAAKPESAAKPAAAAPAPVSAAAPAAVPECAELPDKLQKCEPYECVFTNDKKKKAKRTIVGLEGTECRYEEEMTKKMKLVCKYPEPERKKASAYYKMLMKAKKIESKTVAGPDGKPKSVDVMDGKEVDNLISSSLNSGICSMSVIQ